MWEGRWAGCQQYYFRGSRDWSGRVESDTAALGDTAVLGDRDQVVRAVRNLVVNACVHTDPAGAVSVAAARDGGRVEITVTDRGPGLSPDDAAHVFERFWRADKARTRARGGSGLGMAIVAQIIAAHDGEVRFESAVETGSRVTIVLPVA